MSLLSRSITPGYAHLYGDQFEEESPAPLCPVLQLDTLASSTQQNSRRLPQIPLLYGRSQSLGRVPDTYDEEGCVQKRNVGGLGERVRYERSKPARYHNRWLRITVSNVVVFVSAVGNIEVTWQNALAGTARAPSERSHMG
jgi:hypothetical protein